MQTDVLVPHSKCVVHVHSLDFNFCMKTSTPEQKEGVGMELILSVTISSLSKVLQLPAVLHVAVLYTWLPALGRSQSCSVKLETHWDICPREVSPDNFLIKAHSFI